MVPISRLLPSFFLSLPRYVVDSPAPAIRTRCILYLASHFETSQREIKRRCKVGDNTLRAKNKARSKAKEGTPEEESSGWCRARGLHYSTR